MINIEKGEITNILKGHDDAVNSLFINQDNSAMYSTGNDGTIRVWK
jgi:WD40 repeat protein